MSFWPEKPGHVPAMPVQRGEANGCGEDVSCPGLAVDDDANDGNAPAYLGIASGLATVDKSAWRVEFPEFPGVSCEVPGESPM